MGSTRIEPPVDCLTALGRAVRDGLPEPRGVQRPWVFSRKEGGATRLVSRKFYRAGHQGLFSSVRMGSALLQSRFTECVACSVGFGTRRDDPSNCAFSSIDSVR